MNTATATSVSSEMVIQRVETLIAEKKLAEATTVLNALEGFAHADPRFHVLCMSLAEASNKPGEALAAARKAVEKAPNWVPAVLNLALLLARQDRYPEAIEEAQKTFALAPNSSEVLHKLIEIAHRSQQFALAVQWLTHALTLDPGNKQNQRALASDLSRLGDTERAMALLDALVAADAHDTESLLARAHAHLAAGQRGASLQDWDTLLTHQPDNASWLYYRELALGHTPSTQPTHLVSAMFDGMASNFDMHLVRGLRYQLPRQVAAQLLEWHPDRVFNLLDLGCGTGLLGVFLGQIQGTMVGVDASAKMMEQAAQHGVYNRFHHVNLLDALQATPDGLYQVVAALDVFIYVGTLEQPVRDIHRVLVPGGRLVFSCERAAEEEADMVLRSSGRYAHKQSHIVALCRTAGFAQVDVQDIDVRLEGGQPVKGFLVVATKAAATSQ